MSLLDRGNETLTVYPTVDVDDGYGGTQPGPGTPVTVRASVFPATAETEDAPGYVTTDEYRVFARSLPAGPWSRVDWAGETWSVVADPRRFRMSRRMSFDQAVIRKRG